MDSKAISERIKELREYPGRVRADDVIALYEMALTAKSEGAPQPEVLTAFLIARMSAIQSLAEQGGPDALRAIVTLASEAFESALQTLKKK